MGIKLGSVIVTILFLFIAKISFEATIGAEKSAQNPNGSTVQTYNATPNRSPASIQSIDEGYAAHINGPQKTERH